MVSEPLLWPFLSSLIFLSVTPFSFNIASAIITTVAAFHRWTFDVIQPSSLGSGPAAAVVKKFHTARTTAARITITNIAPIAVLKLPQRLSRADLQNRERFNVIGDRTRPYAPLKVSERLITHSMRLHTPPGPSTRRHAPPRACTRLFSLADVSPSDVICHVICWHHLPRHLLTSSADVICHASADVIVWPDRWLWPLTFSVQVLLT